MTAIEGEAFHDCYVLREVVLPNGLKTIGEKAFSSTVITSVSSPSTLTEIEDEAFSWVKIKPLTIPDTVKEIDYDAFNYNFPARDYFGTEDQEKKRWERNRILGKRFQRGWISDLAAHGFR